MATHSSTLAWKIPWTEEPGGLQSTGLHRVRHDWSDLAAAAAYINGSIWDLEKWYWWSYLQVRNKDADVENRLVDPAREGEGETNWEWHWCMYITICKYGNGSCRVTQESSTWCSVITQRREMRGWVGRRFEREVTFVYLWLIYTFVWQKPTQHCKQIILKLKVFKKSSLFSCIQFCDTFYITHQKNVLFCFLILAKHYISYCAVLGISKSCAHKWCFPAKTPISIEKLDPFTFPSSSNPSPLLFTSYPLVNR